MESRLPATSAPVVSVIIPAFNAARSIVSTIHYIKAQTIDSWELIIVDDGSTDETAELVSAEAEKDSRIVFLRRNREPKAQATCRNTGIEHSRGKYIIHFDADDIIEPFCLEQRVLFMERNDDAEYAIFKGESVRKTDNGLIRTGRQWGIPPEGDVLDTFLTARYAFSIWNVIFRSRTFKKILWDENVRIYTDFGYLVSIILKEIPYKFATESKCDYLYCVGNPNAMTTNFLSNDRFQSTLYLFGKTYPLLRTQQQRSSFETFFTLHLKRVYSSGTWEQSGIFTNFYLKYYKKGSYRVRLVYCVSKCFKFLGIDYKFPARVLLKVLFS